MKKTLTTLAFLLLLPLMFGIIAGPGDCFLYTVTAKAATAAPHPIGPAQELIKPVFPGVTITPNPKWELLPDSLSFPFEPLLPDPVTPKPDPVTPKPDDPTSTPTPVGPNTQSSDPTNKPDTTSKGSGRYMTSEGPLFLSFSDSLTQQLYMFTPMDLSVDGEYHFPLIGSTEQVVGDAKVTVASGMVSVNYFLVNGVKLNQNDEFFTFFKDIESIKTLKPSKLQNVKLKFGVPYNIETRMKTDPSVLLYINCPVSYKSTLKGLAPFSFDDPLYLQRVVELVSLVD